MTVAPLLLLGLLASSPQEGVAADPPDVDFAREVRPLLARKCFACHGNDEETQEAGLRLDIREDALADRGGYAALVPGDPEESEMWMRIVDDIDPMPPEHAGEPLQDGEREVIRRWIESGADFAPHWAFQKPTKQALPGSVSDETAIDAFAARALALRGLAMSAPADDLTLYRRLSLDLTGLTPSQGEMLAFGTSDDPNKYDVAVEALLASPAYAERWAAVWLDLARYADSAGHGSDPLRTIWRYRDWVIEAFDKNMPFDEFTVHQLAGDLIEGADTQSRLATAFHRNTMTNTEGGTDDEEFRVLAVKDRVATTMQVWTGITAGCAECHSHKYDPISHVEYYQLFDIFNQTADTDRGDEAPKIPTPTAEQAVEFQRLTDAIAEVDGKAAQRRSQLVSGGPLEAAVLARLSGGFSAPAGSVEFELAEGETGEMDGDGALLIDGSGATATRTATFSVHGKVTSIQLEAMGDPSLPKGGPGRNASSGNFVLTNLLVEELPALNEAQSGALAGVRRVRIDLPGAHRILSLAEVQLLDGQGGLIAVEGQAAQSSTAYGGAASRAIDGSTDGEYEGDSVTHTNTESDPFWEVTLAEAVELSGVRVWTRTDGDLPSRLHGYTVSLFGESGDWRSGPAPSFAKSQVVGPGHPRPILLTVASVTHEQKDFEARRAVDGRISTGDGWAVAGETGRDHAAVFELATPASGRLRVTMEHQWGSDHVIGRLKLGLTGDDPPPLVLKSSVQKALVLAPHERTKEQAEQVSKLIRQQDPALASLKKDSDRLIGERDALGIPKTPVMVELEGAARRETHVLVRGNFMQKAEPVSAAIPAAFGSLPEGVPADRLALARWLVSGENPLTARVTVNRVWARLFGRGLVRSEGDFGSQGDVPTHPELLDWLAVTFMESGWDHKEILRTIVSSRAYRQSSDATEASMKGDPDAVWLSRFPRQRLEAEMVRDMALSVSGLLSSKRFGPSVYPPQPAGLWKAAFNGQRNWSESMGEDRYRRGLYVFLRRTIPYPMLATFDAPSREICTVQRIPTNTPLQAFVTLNDPVFVEASQAFGRELAHWPKWPVRLGMPPSTLGAVMKSAVWRATCRPPTDGQVELLEALYEDALAHFTADLSAATEFATIPLGDLPEGLAPAEAAAWTLVASTVLNLDAALTKD